MAGEVEGLAVARTSDFVADVTFRHYGGRMRKTALVAVTAALALAVPATAAAPPEVVKLRKQVAALNAKVKRLTVERNSARREVVLLKARLTPNPTGSVTLANGENGDRARVTGAGVTSGGNILGQLEYLGGPSCEEFADEVPEEIRDAFKTVAAAFATYAEVLGDIDLSSGATPDPETLQKLAEAAEKLDDAELTAASAEIEAWAKANCTG